MSLPGIGRGGFLGRPRRKPRPPVPHTARQRAVTHMAASVLLDYPDEAHLDLYPSVAAELDGLPGPIADRIATFLARAQHVGPDELAQEYVRTFDLKRKCSLYLSYFLTGDTRRRGTALVTFLEAYRACGYELDAAELPDYLPVVLEFSAVGDPEVAGVLLASHREGLEVLREALTEMASPWAGIVEAVTLTLPHVDEATRQRTLDLIAGGPPAEMVGADVLGPHPVPLGEPGFAEPPAGPQE
ncbi:nitrate reductase molybdenum cofactor assembly chaperone [Raineyella fluvialis]|uniref:Nitrate reductase molybdenum cofactor assembly chaperone n=1 Tax=Raineyella fluvialis TaxID=2662261 RepID=A0A5Q2FBG3_9ACTN|nr:nitrate reductase molybdenum cofactor assembly chaperone [Raineyella fluvialis]QGF22754.1 nitrate reductase molybdenum cofactor assembly chaperone [Raineyella fluvialis]